MVQLLKAVAAFSALAVAARPSDRDVPMNPTPRNSYPQLGQENIPNTPLLSRQIRQLLQSTPPTTDFPTTTTPFVPTTDFLTTTTPFVPTTDFLTTTTPFVPTTDLPTTTTPFVPTTDIPLTTTTTTTTTTTAAPPTSTATTTAPPTSTATTAAPPQNTTNTTAVPPQNSSSTTAAPSQNTTTTTAVPSQNSSSTTAAPSQNTTTTTAVPLQNSSSTTTAFPQNSTTTTSQNSITTDPYTTTTSPNLITTDPYTTTTSPDLITTDPYTTTTSPDLITTDPFNYTDTDPDGANTGPTSTNSSSNASHKLNTGEAVGVAAGVIGFVGLAGYGIKKYREKDAEATTASTEKSLKKKLIALKINLAESRMAEGDVESTNTRDLRAKVKKMESILKEFKEEVNPDAPSPVEFETKQSRNLSNLNISSELSEPEESDDGVAQVVLDTVDLVKLMDSR